MTASTIKKPRLVIRKARLSDVNQISALVEKIYPGMKAWDLACIRSQINHFPQGQFVAVFDNQIVGYCASIRISGKLALKQHSWEAITGNGYSTTHDAEGDYLYGLETCVDNTFWNHHIGHRLYNARKELCIHLHLKGIITGGRMPLLSQEIEEAKTPEKYIQMVQMDKIPDHTLLFQLHNGFEVLGVLKDYLSDDKDSLGFATHLIWHNPEIISMSEPSKSKLFRRKHHYLDKDHVRVAAVQYEQRRVNSFDEFAKNVEYFVRVVAEYRTDFVLFPESFTMQLLSINNKVMPPKEAIQELATYTDRYKEMMAEFAMQYNINIIGGSTPTQEDANIQNVSYIFLRDGSIAAQAKIHPTPDERLVWNMKGASRVDKIVTDCGPIGVLICYDCEFPELTRHLINQNILILFVPFCTDQRTGYLRVRYCAQARAVENQCYVVMAGNVGNLPGVNNMNVQYAQSAILTPCDFPFARDGIASETAVNVETIAFADLNIKTLLAARNSGSVINLKDRRRDLYTLLWHEPDKKK